MSKPTRGLSFPKSASAELREMLLREMEQEPGTAPDPLPEEPDTAPEPPPTAEPGGKIVRQLDSQLDSQAEDQKVRSSDGKKGRKADPAERRRTAVRLARELGRSPMKAVGLKLPAELHEYLDAHVHRNWQQKVKKQDLLTRALQLLVIELETGESLADL